MDKQVGRGFVARMSVLVMVLLALLSVNLGEEMETYPDRWHQLDIKAIIDNTRLFKKYKDCYMTEPPPKGCPKDALEIKKYIPEIIDTLCGKCTPAHVEAGRIAINYTCLTRREDYDEVKAKYDPDGSLLRKAEEKFGKLSCE